MYSVRRITLFVAPCLALSLVLAPGCGSDDDGTQGGSDAAVPDKGADGTTPPDGGGPIADTAEPADDATADVDAAPDVDASPPADSTPSPDLPPPPTQTTFGDASRPTELLVPKAYDATKPHTLVITLHGYGSDGATHLDYLGYNQLVDSRGLLVAAPDGSSFSGTLGWNSVPELSSPDDEGYLAALIKEIKSVYNVGKVFVVGHSAGGFMAYRVACEQADLIHGIVALSTSTLYEEKSECSPSRAVALLHVHGTADDQVDYDGGYVIPFNIYYKYPAPAETVSFWAEYNGCGEEAKSVGSLDLDQKIGGAETKITAHDCPANTGAELWSIEGAGHVPQFYSKDFATKTLDWLDKHSAP